APIAWHLLHAHDEKQAFAWYASLFGWTATGAHDLGPELGRHQTFAWDDSGRTVGSVANTVELPRVHPQWLFFFRVDDIERARARVETQGGLALSAMKTPSGNLAAPCDDPQGAAFALYQFTNDSAAGQTGCDQFAFS